MRLKDTGSELIGELGDVGRLKGTRGDHDLAGGDRAVIQLEAEASLTCPDPSDLAVRLDRSNVSAYRSRYAITSSRPG
jgi:hypothetical protein